jgi:hypothetical protein
MKLKRTNGKLSLSVTFKESFLVLFEAFDKRAQAKWGSS